MDQDEPLDETISTEFTGESSLDESHSEYGIFISQLNQPATEETDDESDQNQEEDLPLLIHPNNLIDNATQTEPASYEWPPPSPTSGRVWWWPDTSTDDEESDYEGPPEDITFDRIQPWLPIEDLIEE